MELYTPELTIAGILGFLAPILIAVLKQPRMSRLMTQIITAVMSILVALVAILVTGGFQQPADVAGWGVLALMVLGVAQAAYGLIWKQIGVTNSVEQATSKSTNTNGRHEANG